MAVHTCAQLKPPMVHHTCDTNVALDPWCDINLIISYNNYGTANLGNHYMEDFYTNN